MAKSIHILCFGASLTAGYTKSGVLYHPYANTLKSTLKAAFPSVVIIIDVQGLSGDQVISPPGGFLPRIDILCESACEVRLRTWARRNPHQYSLRFCHYSWRNKRPVPEQPPQRHLSSSSESLVHPNLTRDQGPRPDCPWDWTMFQKYCQKKREAERTDLEPSGGECLYVWSSKCITVFRSGRGWEDRDLGRWCAFHFGGVWFHGTTCCGEVAWADRSCWNQWTQQAGRPELKKRD